MNYIFNCIIIQGGIDQRTDLPSLVNSSSNDPFSERLALVSAPASNWAGEKFGGKGCCGWLATPCRGTDNAQVVTRSWPKASTKVYDSQ